MKSVLFYIVYKIKEFMKSEGIWKHFKKGDIIKAKDIWGNKLFVIHALRGNEYLPLISAYFLGKPQTNRNMCNFDLRFAKLITSPTRPLRNIKTPILVKLIRNKNIEAKREFIIRNHKK